MRLIEFALRGDWVPLDALLKATGLAPSGGFAKRMVGDAQVRVDGAIELRKRCKVRAGQVVSLSDVRVQVVAAPDLPDTS